MGTARIGYHVQTGEKCVIKEIHPNLIGQPLIRQAIQNEASMVFDHPNIIRMLGMCDPFVGRGPLFLLSEYVQGRSADVYCQDSLSHLDEKDRESRILWLVEQICDGLQYMHDHSVVHRDIKPGNVIISDTGTATIMDLGIAARRGSDFSRLSGFLGTDSYSAPETMVSQTEIADVTPQVDIYALGVMAYELITGSNPFRSTASREELRNLKELGLPKNGNVSNGLLCLLRTATDYSPMKRFASATAFKEQIDLYLNHNGRYTIQRLFGRSH